MAPSHYLNQSWPIMMTQTFDNHHTNFNSLRPNQCWYFVNWTLRNKLQRNINRNSNIFIQKFAFENVCEMAAILFRLQYVNVTQFGSIRHWCNRVQRNRKSKTKTSLGIILWKCRANGRWHYNATSLIGWAHTQNHPCSTMHERSQQHTRHTTCIQCMMYLDIKSPTKSSKDLRLQILF